LAGGHEAHRAAQAAILESIAHAMLLALHSLHCTDKCLGAGPACGDV
jgi:hypothetical protein